MKKLVYMNDLEKRKKAYGSYVEENVEKVALKTLDNSSCISTEFLNEIKTHLQIYLWDVIRFYEINQCKIRLPKII
ncbi:kinase-like domain-containing protein [Rhizophagus clarus]|uniref:Kinase-like domain-containing protein n=1 Tax=Rhizophagus clarus TaxID=94130 RepID=A0A8H3QUU4_9GLOM|nr:kinase-like domain-containing protein [Rhizophagus clarus]